MGIVAKASGCYVKWLLRKVVVKEDGCYLLRKLIAKKAVAKISGVFGPLTSTEPCLQ